MRGIYAAFMAIMTAAAFITFLGFLILFLAIFVGFFGAFVVLFTGY